MDTWVRADAHRCPETAARWQEAAHHLVPELRPLEHATRRRVQANEEPRPSDPERVPLDAHIHVCVLREELRRRPDDAIALRVDVDERSVARHRPDVAATRDEPCDPRVERDADSLAGHRRLGVAGGRRAANEDDREDRGRDRQKRDRCSDEQRAPRPLDPEWGELRHECGGLELWIGEQRLPSPLVQQTYQRPARSGSIRPLRPERIREQPGALSAIGTLEHDVRRAYLVRRNASVLHGRELVGNLHADPRRAGSFEPVDAVERLPRHPAGGEPELRSLLTLPVDREKARIGDPGEPAGSVA